MKHISLTLQLDQVNQILDALGQQPYARVYQLITLIQQQAEAQLQTGEAAAAAPARASLPDVPADRPSTARRSA